MTRDKVKLAWIEDARSRAKSLKKRKAGLLRKVEELSILCDVPVCMIIFSANEVSVWPSVDHARQLLDGFFALPEIVKKKNETSLMSYLKKKTKKLREQVTKIQTKNANSAIDKLMVQIHSGCNIDDLNLSDISQLLYFTRDKVMRYRERINNVHYPRLRDPPLQIFRTTTNGVFVGGGQNNERALNPNEVFGMSNGNRTYYLIDEWFPRTNPSINEPFQIHYINGQPTMVMSEPIQYPFDFMSRGFGANEEGTSGNHGDSQFRMSNTLAITDGVRRESSSSTNKTSFGMNGAFNNNHF